MKGRAIIPLVLGLCMGLIAVKILVNKLQSAQGSTVETAMVSVVRATRDIGSFEEITPDMVEVIETVDNTFVPAGERISATEDVVGRVAAKSIPKSGPVLTSMIAPVGTPPGMVGRIPPGFRAVSVKVDEVTSVAYQLSPGDWVDVIVVMDVETGGQYRRKDTIAEVILQRVRVAAVGRATGGTSNETGATMKPAKSATLLIAEEDVPKLHLAQTRGKLTLAMRGSEDDLLGNPIVARGSEVFSFEREAALAELGVQPTTTSTKTASAIRRPDIPHILTVFHGSTLGQPPAIEQLTFQNANSRAIVGLRSGPVTSVRSSRPGPNLDTDSSGLQQAGDVGTEAGE